VRRVPARHTALLRTREAMSTTTRDRKDVSDIQNGEDDSDDFNSRVPRAYAMSPQNDAERDWKVLAGGF